MSWVEHTIVGFDLETTAADPEDARIVTAALVECDPTGGGYRDRSWIVDPGVEVPEEAAAIHGFTTERLRIDGVASSLAVPAIVDALAVLLACGATLAIFNARYDLTVLDRECRRLGVPPLQDRQVDLYVVDPLVIDKWLDRYRKSYPDGYNAERAKVIGIPSTRTLAGMAGHYRARLDDAHEATADALAAARIAWRIGTSATVVRRVRDELEAHELQELRNEWARVRDDLPELHKAQRAWALEERDRFAAYKRSQGDHETAARIEAEVGWPILARREESTK